MHHPKLFLHISSNLVQIKFPSSASYVALPGSAFKVFVVGLKLHHPEGGGGLGDPNLFLHISSSLVKIRLHTEIQLPELTGSGGVVAVSTQLCGHTNIIFGLKLDCDT